MICDMLSQRYEKFRRLSYLFWMRATRPVEGPRQAAAESETSASRLDIFDYRDQVRCFQCNHLRLS